MYNRFVAVVLLACVTLAVSCTKQILNCTVVSTVNLDLSRAASFKRGATPARGQDIAHLIILIPTGSPHLETAIDRAIKSVPGCIALVDVRATQSWWYVPYVYGRFWITVEGTPLIDPKLSLLQTGNYFVTEMDPSGHVKQTRVVSEVEFDSIRRGL